MLSNNPYKLFCFNNVYAYYAALIKNKSENRHIPKKKIKFPSENISLRLFTIITHTKCDYTNVYLYIYHDGLETPTVHYANEKLVALQIQLFYISYNLFDKLGM